MENKKSKINKSEYTELVDFLGKKFDKIDERFEKIDERFDKIEGRLDGMEGRLDGMASKTDIDRVLTRIGDLSNKVDDYRAEQLGIKRQVEKHEKWHHLEAEKLGLELD